MRWPCLAELVFLLLYTYPFILSLSPSPIIPTPFSQSFIPISYPYPLSLSIYPYPFIHIPVSLSIFPYFQTKLSFTQFLSPCVECTPIKLLTQLKISLPNLMKIWSSYTALSNPNAKLRSVTNIVNTAKSVAGGGYGGQ